MSSFYGNVGIGDGSGGGGSSIDDGSYVQITGDIMTGPLGTTELTVGSRGTGSVGEKSFTSGYNNVASNSNTSAEGYQTVASGSCAHSEGHQTTASGDDSHAEGRKTVASGQYAHAEGSYTQATGDHAHAEGSSGSVAAGIGSHAEGGATEAIGNYSHAEGNNTHAIGWSSHAEGTTSIASGSCSHAEGQHTTASGANSHAEGSETIAASANQHVNGKFNVIDSSNTYAEIVGNGTSSSDRSNAYTLDWNGNATYAGRVTAGTNPVNSMDLTTKQYVDNLVTNMSGGSGEDTYYVTLSDSFIKVPFNAAQYAYNNLQSSNASQQQNSILASAKVGTSQFNTGQGSQTQTTDDPSTPNVLYVNPNSSPLSIFGQISDPIFYTTYHGNQSVPGFLTNIKLINRIGEDATDSFLKVQIESSFYTLEEQNNYRGAFIISFNFDGIDARDGEEISQKDIQSFKRISMGLLRESYGIKNEFSIFTFFILLLTFNIDGHLVTKDIPIIITDTHETVYVQGTDPMIIVYNKAKYLCYGDSINTLAIGYPFTPSPLNPQPLWPQYEILFTTNDTPPSLDEFFSSDMKNIVFPEWFQLYSNTFYDISFTGPFATVASWSIPSSSSSPLTPAPITPAPSGDPGQQ